jgi:hypothetical protein
MSTDAALRIAALRRSHDDLVRFVDDFDERLLETGSGAADWTVAQVLGHLGSGAEIAYGTLRAALAGGPAPDRETLVPIWERWNALLPLDALAAFRQSDERLVAEYEGLDEATLDDLRIDLGFLPAPIDVATAASVTPAQHTKASRSMSPEHAVEPSPPVAGCSPAGTPALPLSSAQVIVSWKTRPLARSVISAAYLWGVFGPAT